MRSLGIDVGGGGARWALMEDGAILQRGAAGSFNGHLFRPEVRAAAEAALAAIAAATGPVENVLAGVTGMTAPTPESVLLTDLITEILEARRVEAMSDTKLAYLCVFAPGEGILVYAGTGSAAAHVAVDGGLTLVGGKGVIIDDAGGGYWIATRALRSLLRREDAAPGSAWETPLGQAFARAVGGADWPSVRHAVYGGERGGIGRLAVAVAEAAAASDPSALGVLEAAGRELASFARAMETRIGRRLPVALAGGAARLHPAIFSCFAEALPGVHARLATLDPAAGAALLASRSASGEGQIRGGAD
jgi:N-acetylglucosamine kinase-like BadF-type ATPase